MTTVEPKALLRILGIWLLSAVSCKSSAQLSTAPTVFLGHYTPHAVTGPQDGVIKVGFLQSARSFTLAMDRPGAERYRQLLLQGVKQDVPLRIYVFEHTTHIAVVRKAPKDFVREYKKSTSRH